MAYSQEEKANIFNEICGRIAVGESLRSICKDEHIPHISTIMEWLADNKTYSERYARAKSEQADYYAEEIKDITDELMRTPLLTSERVQAARLLVDTRKWIASKLKPIKYGEASLLKVQGDKENPLETINTIKIELVPPSAGE